VPPGRLRMRRRAPVQPRRPRRPSNTPRDPTRTALYGLISSTGPRAAARGSKFDFLSRTVRDERPRDIEAVILHAEGHASRVA
jgi:hypothetical protein